VKPTCSRSVFIFFIIKEVINPEKYKINEGIYCYALGRGAIKKSLKESGGNDRINIKINLSKIYSKGGKITMKTDAELQRDVMDELKWEPTIKAAEIGIGVKDGVVTLSGYVDNYAKKRAAERVAIRVFGVKAVVEELQVKLPSSFERSDEDIAQVASHAIQMNVWTTHMPQRIKVMVEDGWITLSGDVDWRYQKDAIGDTLRNHIGVRGLSNNIIIKPIITKMEQDVKDEIESAFKRNALLDSRRITVETRDDYVILRGSVRSWAEREQVELAACAAPGVSEVENNIIIIP
jgi:osmotically-inducible protein OsmY